MTTEAQMYLNYLGDKREIVALREEIERLRGALTPFAALNPSDRFINSAETTDAGLCAAYSYTAGDYRRARAALKGNGEG